MCALYGWLDCVKRLVETVGLNPKGKMFLLLLSYNYNYVYLHYIYSTIYKSICVEFGPGSYVVNYSFIYAFCG